MWGNDTSLCWPLKRWHDWGNKTSRNKFCKYMELLCWEHIKLIINLLLNSQGYNVDRNKKILKFDCRSKRDYGKCHTSILIKWILYMERVEWKGLQRVRVQYRQGLDVFLACMGIRAKVGLEGVSSGEMSLDRCIRIKS